MSITAEWKGNDGHSFNKINWMYISTSDRGTHYNEKHGEGDDEVVIDYDDTGTPCGVWIRKPHEIEIFDEEGEYTEVMETDTSKGQSVIMMDTIDLDSEVTMKIANDEGLDYQFKMAKSMGIQKGKTYLINDRSK